MSQDARCYSHGIVCFLGKERGPLVFAPHVASWQHAHKGDSVPSSAVPSATRLDSFREIETFVLRARERTVWLFFQCSCDHTKRPAQNHTNTAGLWRSSWACLGAVGCAGAMVSKARVGAKSKQKADPRPVDNTAAPRTLSYSLKSKKAGRQLEVMVQIPRSTPSSVLNIEADEQGLRVDTGKWGGGYALAFEWPAPFTGKVRAGTDIEVHKCLRSVGLDWCSAPRKCVWMTE